MNAGDEIILFEPWYENYLPQTILAGATLRLFTLEPPDYRIDLNKLKSMISSRTKAVILNTPNNPTGRVFSIEEMTGIADLCRTHNLYAIVDEIYQHIVYDGHEHVSLASIDNMACRTITINGISKAFAATGWRVGWAIAPETLTLAIRRVHDFLTGTVPTPFQDAAIAGLSLPDSYFRMIVERYDKRRKLLADLLTEAGVKFFSPAGTYYLFADISNFGFDSSETFTESLLKEARVAVVPGTAFFRTPKWRDKMVRLTFSKDDETIACAGERIVEWARNRYRSMPGRLKRD